MIDKATFLAWRKKRPLLLKISFVLILAGFALGYAGGVNDNAPLVFLAFLLWGGAGAASLMIKS